MSRNLTTLVVGFLAVALACTAARADVIYPTNYLFDADDASSAIWLEAANLPSGWNSYNPPGLFDDVDYNDGPGSYVYDGSAPVPHIPGSVGHQFLGMFDNHASPQIDQTLSNTIQAGYAYQLSVDYGFASMYGGTSTITLSANGPVTIPTDDGSGNFMNLLLEPGPGTLITKRVIDASEVTTQVDWNNWVVTQGGFTTFSTGIVVPDQSLVGQPLTVSVNVDGGGLPGGGDDQQNVGTTWFLNNVRINEIMPGDANADGQVDINDLTIVLAHYNQAGGWSEGEFTGNGTVDINDLTIVLAHYGQTSGAGISTVPEPASILLLAAGAIGLLVCAWRKRK